MTKYARNVGGCWVDVWTAPGDFSNLKTLQKCLPGAAFVAVDDAVKSGDFADGESGYIARPAPNIPLPPRILSKTAFQDFAVSKLGTGTTGMARFQEIMDNCAAQTGAVKFCFSRYEAAETFAKDQVDGFTAIMVSGEIMTSDERSAIIADWPT